MAHLHKKLKKGRPYYYLREIKRVDGKPKVVSQIYLGSAETIAKRFQQHHLSQRPIKTQTQAFGALLMAHELEKEFNTIGLVDAIVPRGKNEQGPSVGEYFFYAWANRLIDPKSKHALEQWYAKTAIQHIRAVDLGQLTSLRYWQKWDRVTSADIDKIGQAFFEKLWAREPAPVECCLFDTTNLFSYLDSATPSELCQRGRNKASKHHLRQIGLGLLVDRHSQIPIFYQLYPGNQHDAKFFNQVMDELFGVVCSFNQTQQKLTVVFDKGMNSEENISFIDGHAQIHFVTTYSPHFVEELATLKLKDFSPLAIEKNRKLLAQDKPEDLMTAYRTTKQLWGKERTVLVTYHPKSYRKQTFTLLKKLETVREELLLFRHKHKQKLPHWKNPEAIVRRYERLCERLHIGSQYYQLTFADESDLAFRKNHQEVAKAQQLFGRNIIVTDHSDWTNEQIAQASLDRHVVERSFRTGKDSQHIALRPFFHWTDSKIRCQMLSCLIALTLSRVLEKRLKAAGIITENQYSSTKAIIEQMHALDSVLYFFPNQKKAERVIEDPTPLQSEVLKLFNYHIQPGGVLQQLSS